MSTFPFHNVRRKAHRRVFLALSLFIATLSLLLAGRGAQAQTLEITVGGTVTNIRNLNNYFPTLAVGDAFSATFLFPVSAPNGSGISNIGAYQTVGADYGFTGRIGDVTINSWNASQRIYVTDSQRDSIRLASAGVSLSGATALPPSTASSMQVNLYAPDGNLFNSVALPSADFYRLSNFSTNQSSFSLIASKNQNPPDDVSGTITSLSARVLPIPEPGTLAYAALGLVGFCAWRRRRA